MKSSTHIQQQIKQLQQQLEKVKAREREQRVTLILSVLDKSGLSDKEAVAVIEAAAKSREAGQ